MRNSGLLCFILALSYVTFVGGLGSAASAEAQLAMAPQPKKKCITIGDKRICFEDDAKNRDDDDDDDDKPKKKKRGNICGGETACPPGYVVLDKPNKYGACCEAKEGLPKQAPAQEAQKCKFGMIGTPPNCSCPEGSEFQGYKGCVCPQGATLTPEGCVHISSREAKTNFTEIDFGEVLAKIEALPVMSWNYLGDDASTHIGPFAEDFHQSFGLNGSNQSVISFIDSSGVALAGIKGLIKKTRELEAENATLRSENETLRMRLDALEAKVEQVAPSRQ
jgi:hypothetical protein